MCGHLRLLGEARGASAAKASVLYASVYCLSARCIYSGWKATHVRAYMGPVAKDALSAQPSRKSLSSLSRTHICIRSSRSLADLPFFVSLHRTTHHAGLSTPADPTSGFAFRVDVDVVDSSCYTARCTSYNNLFAFVM